MFEAKSSIVLPQQAIKDGTGTEPKKKLLEQTRDKLGKLIFHVWVRTLFAKSSVTQNLNPSFIATKVDATFSFNLNSTKYLAKYLLYFITEFIYAFLS